MNKIPPADPRLAFARFTGELAESFSFNRSLGQIYGLLYVHEAPISLAEIARRLSMSKGNASVNVRVLEAWGAVRSVAAAAARGDHYEANRDIKSLALRRLREGLSRRLEVARERLGGLAPQSGGDKFLGDRLKDLEKAARSAERVMRFLAAL